MSEIVKSEPTSREQSRAFRRGRTGGVRRVGLLASAASAAVVLAGCSSSGSTSRLPGESTSGVASANLQPGSGGSQSPAPSGSPEAGNIPPTQNQESTQPASSPTVATSTSVGRALFTFDSHGSDLSKGGSNVIQIYGDPSENGRDSNPGNNGFMNGQTASIDCYTEGRTVSTVTGEGETAGHSDIWFRLAMGKYATGAYGEPSRPMQGIPHC